MRRPRNRLWKLRVVAHPFRYPSTVFIDVKLNRTPHGRTELRVSIKPRWEVRAVVLPELPDRPLRGNIYITRLGAVRRARTLRKHGPGSMVFVVHRYGGDASARTFS